MQKELAFLLPPLDVITTEDESFMREAMKEALEYPMSPLLEA